MVQGAPGRFCLPLTRRPRIPPSPVAEHVNLRFARVAQLKAFVDFLGVAIALEHIRICRGDSSTRGSLLPLLPPTLRSLDVDECELGPQLLDCIWTVLKDLPSRQSIAISSADVERSSLRGRAPGCCGTNEEAQPLLEVLQRGSSGIEVRPSLVPGSSSLINSRSAQFLFPFART